MTDIRINVLTDARNLLNRIGQSCLLCHDAARESVHDPVSVGIRRSVGQRIVDSIREDLS